MCRFALYLGPELPISSLVTEPTNSIIHQSFHSQLREEPLNGDGFGLAWYPKEGGQPALFKEVSPAWSNLNLKELARVTHSSAILAHVRAATLGLPVHQLNCHPFRYGELSFMHNGSLQGFATCRRDLLRELSEEAFSLIEGNTDSEHLFAIFVDALQIVEAEGHPRPDSLAMAMERTLASAESLRAQAMRRHPGKDPLPPSRLNLVVSDGVHAVATRFVSPGELTANSLYLQSGRAYVCEDGVCRMRSIGKSDAPEVAPIEGASLDAPPATAAKEAGRLSSNAIVLASEPLSDEESWEAIEENTLVIVRRGSLPLLRKIELAPSPTALA